MTKNSKFIDLELPELLVTPTAAGWLIQTPENEVDEGGWYKARLMRSAYGYGRAVDGELVLMHLWDVEADSMAEAS